MVRCWFVVVWLWGGGLYHEFVSICFVYLLLGGMCLVVCFLCCCCPFAMIVIAFDVWLLPFLRMVFQICLKAQLCCFCLSFVLLLLFGCIVCDYVLLRVGTFSDCLVLLSVSFCSKCLCVV